MLCAGLYPNVAKMEFKLKPGVPRLYTREDGKVAFHPKSVNAKEERFPAKFLIYNTKVKSTGVGGCVGQVRWSLVVCVCGEQARWSLVG